jgi:hypothetical protein
MNTQMNYTRVNISMPKDFFRRLKRLVPNGKISAFLVEAGEEKLRTKEVQKAMDELRNSPPAFPEIKDSAKWVRELRKENEKRMKRLGL